MDVATLSLTLDCLPFDCIVTICEYLSAEDLARLSRVCSIFHEATQVGYLWRRLSLARWAFCNVRQISDGPTRWRRYFVARRSVDARMDTGKPIRDYRVRTLRGHEADVTCVVVLSEGSEGDVNWENPRPPLVVSLSSDGCVKAWDVMQGKAVWSLEGEHVSRLAASDSRGEVALGLADGSVQLWEVGEWTLRATFPTSSCGTSLMYGSIKTRKQNNILPNTFLLAHTLDGHMELWDPDMVIANADKQDCKPVKPVLKLWSPSHITHCQLSSEGLLSMDSGFADVYVFDLLSLSLTHSTPHSPHITLHTSDHVISTCWVEPRCLATASRDSINIDLWDLGSHMDALLRAKRSLYDKTNIYNPGRTISNEVPPLCMGVTNGLLITGDGNGHLRVLDYKSGTKLQIFKDHRASITDLHTDGFRVLSCSTDFSIRVYRWGRGNRPRSAPAQLETRYTLLGGSVALKQHAGFNRILCETSSCVGVAGNQLKFYTFSATFDPTP